MTTLSACAESSSCNVGPRCEMLLQRIVADDEHDEALTGTADATSTLTEGGIWPG